MSRSIHTTHRELWRLAQRRFQNPEARARALEKAKQEIERKRLIKRCVREERRREAPPLVTTPAEMIPVEVQDTDLDERVFHPHALGDLEASEHWIRDWSKSYRRPRPLERLRELVQIRVNRAREPARIPEGY